MTDSLGVDCLSPAAVAPSPHAMLAPDQQFRPRNAVLLAGDTMPSRTATLDTALAHNQMSSECDGQDCAILASSKQSMDIPASDSRGAGARESDACVQADPDEQRVVEADHRDATSIMTDNVLAAVHSHHQPPGHPGNAPLLHTQSHHRDLGTTHMGADRMEAAGATDCDPLRSSLLTCVSDARQRLMRRGIDTRISVDAIVGAPSALLHVAMLH